MINLPGTHRLSLEDFDLYEAMSGASEPLSYTSTFAPPQASASTFRRNNLFSPGAQRTFDGAYFHERAFSSVPYSDANIWPHPTTYARFDDFDTPLYADAPERDAANGSLWSSMCALPFTVLKLVGRLLYLPFELIGMAVCAVANFWIPAPHEYPSTAQMPRATRVHQWASPALTPQAQPVPLVASWLPTTRPAQASSTMRATPMARSAGFRYAAANTNIEALDVSMLREALATSIQPDIPRNTFDWDYGQSSVAPLTSSSNANRASELVTPAPIVAYANPPICPISFVPLIYAVTTACEHAFDKDAMQMWLDQGHSDCPCCSAPVHKETMHDDVAVRAYARYWLQTHSPAPSATSSMPHQTDSTIRKTALKTWAEQARRDIYPHPPECPISAEPFTEAVTTLCGHSFQKYSILQWVTLSSTTCPCCRAPVQAHQLRPNRELNQFSALWVEAGSPQTIPEPAYAALHARQYLSPEALGMPDALTCAFSHLPLRDPVKAPCGHTFERSSIVDVLQVEQRCPLDDQATAPGDLVSDGATTRAVVEWQLKTLQGMPAENWDAIYFAQEFAYA